MSKNFIKEAFSHKGSPLASVPNLSLDTTELTILFCDIRSFTGLSEITPPAVLGQFLNEYFSLMADIITDHKGTVDKYIGDGIMAIWGAPSHDPHHAANAVQAALEMHKAIAHHRDQLQLAGQRIKIGIGINTGPVSVGNFGSRNKLAYTAMGDTVNLASRIENLTKFYQAKILISKCSKKAIEPGQYCQFIDHVMVRGRNRAVELFEPMVVDTASDSRFSNRDKYRQAIKYFKNRQFTESLIIFEELYEQRSEDLYRIYIERNARLIKYPPPSVWNGVYNHN